MNSIVELSFKVVFGKKKKVLAGLLNSARDLLKNAGCLPLSKHTLCSILFTLYFHEEKKNLININLYQYIPKS